MIDAIKKIIGLLTSHERKKTLILLLMMVLVALFDVTGVASILPFTAVLANPELIHNNSILNFFYKQLNFSSDSSFLLALGGAVFLLMILTLLCKGLGLYFQLMFTLKREYSISSRLLEGYLAQPYAWFLQRNSASLAKTVFSEVNQVVLGGILPLLNIVAHGSIVCILLIMLLLIDPFLALTTGFVLGLMYILLYRASNKFLVRIGKECADANHNRFHAISEVFGAVKEVKFAGLEKIYLERFSKEAKIYASHQASERLLGQLPRFGLEAIAFGGMMAVLLYLIAKSESVAAALPIIALYAFSGYRLMPALQQIYVSVTSIKFSKSALDALCSDLLNINEKKNIEENLPPIEFNKEILIKNASFFYDGSSRAALDEINLRIDAKSSIAFVGKTGSGKTTLIDIILGLLRPSSGSFFVDEIEIDSNNMRSWQSLLGYVPQQIFLTDNTIEANIAFGVLKNDDIDHDAVIKAAKIACLHDVVEALPLGYQTIVGERGVRLSGGQRQRIGIARALYKKPRILVFDEATSALDNSTESALLESIKMNCEDITLIMVAHRLSTVRDCKQICLLDQGVILAKGSHELLKSVSKDYQNLLVPQVVQKVK